MGAFGDFLNEKTVKLIESFGTTDDDRREVVSRERAGLRGEADVPVGEQDLGFADAARIKNDLAGRGIAGVVLVGDAEIEVAEWHPDPLAAPAHMDHALRVGQELAEDLTGLGRQRSLEARGRNARGEAPDRDPAPRPHRP